MKIICTKEEFAEMLGHCVSNLNGNDYEACGKCAIYEKCNGAFVDTLTKIIEVENDATD
jgi:hypothetical protein